MSFIQKIEERRTIYNIGNEVELTNPQIEALIKKAIRLSPSAFNSQSSRAVILFDESHHSFWEIVRNTLRQHVVQDQDFSATSKKIDSFAAGKGTVLFYEDQTVVQELQQKFPAYADHFPVWSEHSSAIAQFSAWMALHEEKIGASLQHYNPIIDSEVAEKFAVPASWKLRAQLVFGSIEAEPKEKDFIDDSKRFKTFG